MPNGRPERSARTLYVDALDALLSGRVGAVAHSRDWELLREVARLAQEDAPKALATTDPALFESWRAAVTRYHVAGWGNMTPERVDSVVGRRDGTTYPPEAIRVLEGMAPPRRPAGHVEDAPDAQES